MGLTEAVRKTTEHHIQLAGRRVEYRLVRSTTARKMRVRIGPGGFEVVHPAGRGNSDVPTFLNRNKGWVLAQLDRVVRLSLIKRTLLD
jgi:predicted metal-dependent hydrolase